MNAPKKEKISGKYKHYKGNFYDVFCVAYDKEGNKYVLYQQCYGDKCFWIRPYDMFFDHIEFNGEDIKRFTLNSQTPQSPEKKIRRLIDLVTEQEIYIRHTETELPFVITHINELWDYVIVYPDKEGYYSGYLTEYEIFRRLGYNSCRINNEIKYFKRKETIEKGRALHIGKNDIELLKNFINPCSVDLQIANSGFLQTKYKLVDPLSIENISSATELWTSVKQYKSKNNISDYIKIHPGATILTHTKERIQIPNDCAGKIEIKSTFARLSLSITFGDFCNPGYDGYFPLEIKNNGKHTVIIHAGETMAQLILVPLQGPILNEYSTKATFKNKNGFDDGTPYSFWRERSIKALRKENGTQKLIDLSNKLLSEINVQNTSDVNACKDRFSDNFLPFCHKRINKPRYRDNNSNLPDTKKLMDAYLRKERVLKSLLGIKWVSGIASFICTIFPVAFELINNSKALDILTFFSKFWLFFVFAGIFLVVAILLLIFCPKTFCTFESIDLQRCFDDM